MNMMIPKVKIMMMIMMKIIMMIYGVDERDDDEHDDNTGNEDVKVTKWLLLDVDVMKEVEDTARVLRCPMIRPAKEVEVENSPDK